MKSVRAFTLVIATVFSLTLTACSTISHDIKESSTRSSEDQLRAAGFKIMIADNQERQEMLNGLPPETITRIPRPDNVYYIYPDPDVCMCLYVGREEEFQSLQQLRSSGQQSNQAMIAHQMDENQRAGWSPAGPWGNWGWWLNNPNSMGRPAWDPS